MAGTAEFWSQVGVTLERFGLGLLFGSLTGFGLGLAAGLHTRVKWLLEPLRWFLMTMPPVVMVVVSMIWFGMGSTQTVFVTALLILPIIYVNTMAGIEAIDSRVVEMSQVYGAGGFLRLKEIYLPGLSGPVLAGLTLAAGLGIRIVVLAGFENHYPAQLSGGMSQRVSIARAFAIVPEILLMDEPFSALDTELKSSLLDDVKEMLSLHPSMTALYVTHNPEELANIASKVYTICQGGRTVESRPWRSGAKTSAVDNIWRLRSTG